MWKLKAEQKLQKETGKILTLKDLSNLAAQDKKKDRITRVKLSLCCKKKKVECQKMTVCVVVGWAQDLNLHKMVVVPFTGKKIRCNYSFY